MHLPNVLEGYADGGTGTGNNNNQLLVAIEQLMSKLNDRDQALLVNDVEIASLRRRGRAYLTLSCPCRLNCFQFDRTGPRERFACRPYGRFAG